MNCRVGSCVCDNGSVVIDLVSPGLIAFFGRIAGAGGGGVNLLGAPAGAG